MAGDLAADRACVATSDKNQPLLVPLEAIVSEDFDRRVSVAGKLEALRLRRDGRQQMRGKGGDREQSVHRAVLLSPGKNTTVARPVK